MLELFNNSLNILQGALIFYTNFYKPDQNLTNEAGQDRKDESDPSSTLLSPLSWSSPYFLIDWIKAQFVRFVLSQSGDTAGTWKLLSLSLSLSTTQTSVFIFSDF